MSNYLIPTIEHLADVCQFFNERNKELNFLLIPYPKVTSQEDIKKYRCEPDLIGDDYNKWLNENWNKDITTLVNGRILSDFYIKTNVKFKTTWIASVWKSSLDNVFESINPIPISYVPSKAINDYFKEKGLEFVFTN